MVQQSEFNKVPETEPATVYDKTNTLLKTFDIPIGHLDFNYVEKCENAKELEQILQILQSGEEGFYPQLTQFTEERLLTVHPRSKYLRKTVPILNKRDFSREDWENISSDVQNFVEKIAENDQEVNSLHETNTYSKKIPIRSKLEPTRKSKQKTDRIRAMEYEKWDKLDVDAEILKMDLEEERIKKETLDSKKEKEEINTVVLDTDIMTQAELSHMAEKFKINGNESFKVGDYEEALQYYTNSITYIPLAVTYNNRAITNIKLGKYYDAVGDCDEVLKQEPKNEKALYRKATALKHIDEYNEAYKVLNTLIGINPNNADAQNMLIAVKGKIAGDGDGNNKSTRFKIQDITDRGDGEKKELEKVEKSKKKESEIIVPIPCSSKSSGPFYKVIENNRIKYY